MTPNYIRHFSHLHSPAQGIASPAGGFASDSGFSTTAPCASRDGTIPITTNPPPVPTGGGIILPDGTYDYYENTELGPLLVGTLVATTIGQDHSITIRDHRGNEIGKGKHWKGAGYSLGKGKYLIFNPDLTWIRYENVRNESTGEQERRWDGSGKLVQK